jgi:raffinose/stachyose/melibiose transport system substrate-binding protein
MRSVATRMVVLVVGLSLVLAACTPVAPGAPGAAETSDEIRLTYWFGVGSGGTEGIECIIANVIDPYNAQADGILVEPVLLADAWNATRTAVAGGGGPDIVGTPGPSFAFEMARAGQLLALNSYVESLGWADIFAPWALNLGEVDGDLYSVPDELETLILYYNKTLFEQNGWQPPNTMDEMMALADEIAAADIIPFSHANAEWRPSNEWFVGEFFNAVAGPDNVYLALTGQKSWSDPEFVESIELLNRLQLNGYFMGGLDRYYTATGDERHTAFGDGRAAMNIEGTWAFDNMGRYFGEAAGNDNDWDWVPIPTVTGEDLYTLGIGNTWSINAATPHPDAVADFLTYFFLPETQARRLSQCGTAPAPVELNIADLEGLDPRIASAFAAMTEASDEGRYGYTTWTFWPPKSDVYIYDEIERVWAGQMTTEQYLQGLDALFQEELAAGDIPPIPER